jgi:ABC-type oligopeptide transport system ATPase subunit
MALLEVRDLSVTIGSLPPLDRVTFSVDKGSILGLVGESGSGKSLTAMALMGLLPLLGGKVSQGSVRFDGTELVGLDSERYRALRGRRDTATAEARAALARIGAGAGAGAGAAMETDDGADANADAHSDASPSIVSFMIIFVCSSVNSRSFESLSKSCKSSSS